MGVLRQLARQLGFGPRGRSPKRAKSRRDRFEIEHLEKRCPMAADIHLGVVYYEDSLSGSDGGPDAFKVSWNGGAPGTELTHLAIYTDKEMTIGPDGKVVPGSGNGLTNGDIFFDTAAGGAGAFLSHGLTITGTNGFTVTSSSVVDGGSVILFTFSGFNAGEVLEFTIDADEVGFNNSSSAFVEGAEFEGSILDGTFSNPNYFTAQGSARFFDSFTVPNALNVPGDDYSPPNPASNETPVRTAGGFVQLTQTPKPSSIRGHVHADRDGDCEYDPGEPLLQGVQIDLLDVNGNVIATTFTDVNGEYLFDNLLPGTYGVFEHQPVGYFDGGDQIGSVGGVNSANDTVTQIVLDANVKAVDYNFCEKEPSSIAGLVYVDNGQNGVYDAGDPVIPNVKIELLNDQGAVVATTTTNSNGQYAFNNLPPGTYSVRETQPAGYYDWHDNVGSLGGTNPSNDILGAIVLIGNTHGVQYNFGELLPASISGNVHADRDGDCELDPGEPGIAGVLIELLNAQGQVIATTTTDADGNYKFQNLMPGTYGVHEVQPAGYFDGGEDVGSAGGLEADDLLTQVVLGSGVHAVDYNFCEKEPSSIRGQVHADLDGDCEYDPGEPLIQGVKIELLNENNQVVATTFTDVNGEYAFENLPPGTYSVRETQPVGYYDGGQDIGSLGGYDVANDWMGGIILLGNTHGVHYDFCEKLPASIQGNVHADRNGDCIRDPGEPGIEGVVIELLDENGVVIATTLTDADGNYEFVNLKPGKYGIHEIQPEGYFDGGQDVGSAGGVEANDLLTEIVLGSGVNAVDYNFCEKEPVCIGGYVYVDIDNDGVFDSNEIGIAGVLVNLLDKDGNVIDTTTTDVDGSYGFCDLPPGTYGVAEVQPNGYQDGLDTPGDAGGTAQNPGDMITGAILTPSVKAKNYNFGEVLPSSISGYVFQDGPAFVLLDFENALPPILDNLGDYRDGVRDAGDKPIAGARLYLTDGEGNYLLDAADNPISTVTDANGFYRFTNLAPGTYGVTETQPFGYYDGFDSPGTGGGSVAHPGDSIRFITLGYGSESFENNFSEIAAAPSFLPLIPVNPPNIPPFYVGAGGLPIVPPIEPIVYLPPQAPPPPDYYGSGVLIGYTWHLSVVNAGQPRSQQNNNDQQMAQLRTVADSTDGSAWLEGSMQNGRWLLQRPMSIEEREAGQFETVELIFGAKRGLPVTGDFNGDGITDVGLFVDGQWFIDLNGNGTWDSEDLWAKLGYRDDLPATGDWDGDGKTDIAIFGRAWPGDPRAVSLEPGLPDPDNTRHGKTKNVPPGTERAPLGFRVMQRTVNGRVRSDLIDHVFNFGVPGDVPLAGDWNGDGVATIGIFRDGRWDLDIDGDGKISDIDHSFILGQAGDKAVVGDFDGDGRDEVGVFRDGKFLIDTNHSQSIDADDMTYQLGAAGDYPAVGDWDGDGIDEVGVYQPASSPVHVASRETAEATRGGGAMEPSTIDEVFGAEAEVDDTAEPSSGR